jgi:membrane protease YdiL (CAAX protease family)
MVGSVPNPPPNGSVISGTIQGSLSGHSSRLWTRAVDLLLTLTNRSGTIDSAIAPSSDVAIQANSTPIAFIGLLILAILTASMIMWSRFVVAYVKGVPFFPSLQPRQIQRWALTDIFMALASLYLVSALAASFATRIGVDRNDLIEGSASSIPKVAIATFQLSAVVLMTFLIAVRYRLSPSNIGWSTKHIFQDIRLGLLAFIMALPPIYVLMIASTVLFKKPYNHPVVDAIKNDPSSLPMAIWLAVVIAPILEEFGFRVLLQGFLESLSRGPLSLSLIFGGRRQMENQSLTAIDSQDFLSRSNESSVDSLSHSWPNSPSNPYEAVSTNENESSGQSINELQQSFEQQTITESSQLPWWPVIVSGVLFGLAHFDYGASWLPLAALGMVLGYLYRITNRIWPSLVVHCCLNGMTMLNLTIITLYGDPSKIP